MKDDISCVNFKFLHLKSDSGGNWYTLSSFFYEKKVREQNCLQTAKMLCAVYGYIAIAVSCLLGSDVKIWIWNTDDGQIEMLIKNEQASQRYSPYISHMGVVRNLKNLGYVKRYSGLIILDLTKAKRNKFIPVLKERPQAMKNRLFTIIWSDKRYRGKRKSGLHTCSYAKSDIQCWQLLFPVGHINGSNVLKALGIGQSEKFRLTSCQCQISRLFEDRSEISTEVDWSVLLHRLYSPDIAYFGLPLILIHIKSFNSLEACKNR